MCALFWSPPLCQESQLRAGSLVRVPLLAMILCVLGCAFHAQCLSSASLLLTLFGFRRSTFACGRYEAASSSSSAVLRCAAFGVTQANPQTSRRLYFSTDFCIALFVVFVAFRLPLVFVFFAAPPPKNSSRDLDVRLHRGKN